MTDTEPHIYSIVHFKLGGPRGGLFPTYEVGLGRSAIDRDLRYAEMRCHWQIWHDGSASASHPAFVGFQHYRRWFFFDQFPDARLNGLLDGWRDQFARRRSAIFARCSLDNFQAYVDYLRGLDAANRASLEDYLSDFHIVVPRPWPWDPKRQFISAHGDFCWNLFERALEIAGAGPYIDLGTFYPCNMFVMRWEEFDAYMKFWEHISDLLAARMPTKYSEETVVGGQSQRMIAVLSERLFSFWLYRRRMEKPSLKVLELPHLLCESRERV